MKALAILIMAAFSTVATAQQFDTFNARQPQAPDYQTPGAENLKRDVLAPSVIQELPLAEAKALLKTTEGPAWKPYAVVGGNLEKKDTSPVKKKVKAKKKIKKAPAVTPVAEEQKDAKEANKEEASAKKEVNKKKTNLHKKKKAKRTVKKINEHGDSSTLYKAATVSLTTAPLKREKQVELPE